MNQTTEAFSYDDSFRAAAALPMPGLATVGLARAALEIKSYFRNRQAVVFTIALPAVLLVLFGAIFQGNAGDTGVPMNQVLIAGIIASGLMSTTFSSLAVGIAIERDDGTLTRLAATPMPKAAYFIGKLALVFVTGLAETALLLAIGTIFYGLKLPSDAGHWLTLAWVVTLGIVSCALTGIAYSRLAPNARSAAAIVQLPFLSLQLISGVFFLFTDLPRPMQTIAAVFPLKWLAQGLRSVFLPDSFAAAEAAGGWEHGRTAIVLAVWTVGAFGACLATFRWLPGRER
jgi:ABC-2 type transport system permease protein